MKSGFFSSCSPAKIKVINDYLKIKIWIPANFHVKNIGKLGSLGKIIGALSILGTNYSKTKARADEKYVQQGYFFNQVRPKKSFEIHNIIFWLILRGKPDFGAKSITISD